MTTKEKFEEKFIDKPLDWWKTSYDYPEDVKPSNVWEFVEELLIEERAKVEKECYESPMKAIAVIEERIYKDLKERLSKMKMYVSPAKDAHGDSQAQFYNRALEDVEGLLW